MSYGAFLGIFVCIPLIAVVIVSRASLTRPRIVLLTALALVAVAYTAPWDNLIVVNGVWSYNRRQILGVVIGHVPLEEYVFYVLQVFLTGLVTLALLRWKGRRR